MFVSVSTDITPILINCKATKRAEEVNRDGENASEPDGSEEAKVGTFEAGQAVLGLDLDFFKGTIIKKVTWD